MSRLRTAWPCGRRGAGLCDPSAGEAGGARQCRPLPTVRHPHTGGDPSLAAAATARRSGSSPTPEDSPSEAVTCHWVPHLSHIARQSSRDTQHRRGTLQRLTAGIADRPYTAASPCLCSVFSIVCGAGPLPLRLSDCKPQNVYQCLSKTHTIHIQKHTMWCQRVLRFIVPINHPHFPKPTTGQ